MLFVQVGLLARKINMASGKDAPQLSLPGKLVFPRSVFLICFLNFIAMCCYSWFIIFEIVSFNSCCLLFTIIF